MPLTLNGTAGTGYRLVSGPSPCEDDLVDRVLRIGTRGSLLALRQSEWVRDTLMDYWPGLRVELHVIKTTGDKILDVPLAKVGGKGLFVKEIEDALLEKAVDLAVHSMKDVPAVLPEGLRIGAIPMREDPRDVFISGESGSIDRLPPGARVGTSSLRRAAQVKRIRPDLDVQTLRGNLDTRLRKLREGQYEAIILAAAGLHRMGWGDRITAYLEPADFVPAIGQGALGVEVRTDDIDMSNVLAPLHDEETAFAVEAERSFLKALGGGCQVPVGGFARVNRDQLELTGIVASLDGKRVVCKTLCGLVQERLTLGRRLAGELVDGGAWELLREIYGESWEADDLRERLR